MDNGGFIKLFRKFKDWEWYGDSATKDVFIDLLLSANYSDCRHLGRQLFPGQCVSTCGKIAESTGLSSSKVRTALEHLAKTGEISIEPTNKFTVFTINNFENYQYSGKSVKPANQAQEDTAGTKRECAAIIEACEGNLIHPPNAAEIKAQLKNFPADLIIEATNQAANQNQHSWKYLCGILKNCKKKGITTLDEFKAENFKHDNGNAASSDWWNLGE